MGTALILFVAACGRDGGASSSSDAGERSVVEAADPARAADAASVPADRAGTFEIDGVRHPFLVVDCDLAGHRETGVLLRGTGTASDGRRMTVEVERLARGETVNERATVVFGGIVDGDHWTARGIGWPDGRWFADEAGSEPTDGPLIEISESELTAEGTYRHERDSSDGTGKIHAVCPA